MIEFERETMLMEILEKAPEAAAMFKAIGMHCLGCAMASGETLEEACMVHGVDTDTFIEELNAFVNSKNSEENN